MKINELVTIVIPCKNENDIIIFCLKLINEQSGIKNTRVIISDSSDDNTRELIKNSNYKNLNIEIIDGGLPSVARNNGAILVDTPYVLFLDADIFLQDKNTLKDSLVLIEEKELHLVTARFRVEGKYWYVFPIFEFFRDFFVHHSVCAIGGFMLFDTDEFFGLGAFDTKHIVAEDFTLSNKVKSDKFAVLNKKVYTTDRRFRNKGLFYMIKIAILSILNYNNPKFFEKDHNYWK